MKKTLALLLFIIALLPACKKSPVITPQISNQTYFDSVSDEMSEAAPQQEDIAAFELHEDENPFNVIDNLADYEIVEPVEVLVTPEKGTQGQHGFKDVYYGFDQYDIRQDQRSALEQNKAIAKSLVAKNNIIVLEGHACDSAGSSEYNFMLSEKRAERVADNLVASGIDKNKIRTVGRGSEMRKVSSGNQEQQSPNRRVEFYAYPANTQEAITA